MKFVLLADFELGVTHILAQPFQLSFLDGDKRRKPVPDFLIWGPHIPMTVVNVTSRPEGGRRRNQSFGLQQEIFTSNGWDHLVWTDPNDQFMLNLLFISAFRRPTLMDPTAVESAAGIAGQSMTDPVSIGTAERTLAGEGLTKPRQLLMHLVWRRILTVDLHHPITCESQIWLGRDDEQRTSF